MKGGDVLALGALRAFAKRPELYDELALLLVCDEEWRTADFGHVPRFAGFDACLCFEAGELGGDDEGVVVRRKAAGTIHVTAHGRTAHSRLGARPRAQRAARAGAPPPRSSPPATARTARRTSPPSPRSCAAATRSTSSPAPASCSATCAPTTWTRSRTS